jgi:hypothetical protein
MDARKFSFLSLALLVMLNLQLSAQLKTTLTVEAGTMWNMLKVDDPGHLFERANVRSYVTGLTVGQELIPNLSVVTGVLYVPLRDGINMVDERPHQVQWISSQSFLIPVRAEYRIQPTVFPVSFTPRIGYVHRLNSEPETMYAYSSLLSAPDESAYSYDVQQVFDQPSTHMLEIGVGINLSLSGAWRASFNLSYMTALFDSPSNQFSLDYAGESGSTTSTFYTSKGNSLYTTLAFNLPLSNVWQNKDYRVRARIENSVYKGKAVDKRGQLYLGGEVASLWRQFNSSNPAVGARPMSDRGVFRFANLNTGIYAGYMLTGDLGVDIGVYYQRSNTFYALMYDHEVDYVSSVPAPMYLEFPVRIRYFYDLYKGKVHMAINGGVSVLTHFAKEAYNQGTDDFNYYSPTASAPVDATTSYSASRSSPVMPVLRLGAGVEYKLPLEFPLIATFYVNYRQGFIKADHIEVSNSLPETPAISTVSYEGSAWSVDLGVKIPFRFGANAQCGKLPEREK